jgi:hypothetical protein
VISGLSGSPLEELDHDLLADPRVEDDPVVLARPVLGNADPARAVLVELPFPVPEELHLDASILVGVDLLTFGSDHHGGLGPAYDGLGCQARRAVAGRVGDAGERVGVLRPDPLVRIAGVDGRVLDRGDDVAPVLLVAVVPP